MKEVGGIFLILCYMVFFTGCTINPEKNVSSVSTVKNTYETNTEEHTDRNFNTRNCMLDDRQNLLVMCEDGYEPYTYDKFPDISGNLNQIIQVLCKGDNIVSLDYHDKLFLYYGLEEKKCQIIGGNGVDIFNFSIDREQNVVAFSVENLVFPDLLDDDYRPLLQETFNLLFGESGEDIYRYLMAFYEQPTDGVTDETLINGMRVTYKCTPKHKLVVSLEAGLFQYRD